MAFGITQAKSIFTSKTFWGAVIGLISVLFPTFFQHIAIAIGISDPAMITDKIVGAIGAAFAIYGRFAAVQPVTLTGGPVVVPAPFSAINNPDSTTVRKMAMIETTTTITPVDPSGQVEGVAPIAEAKVIWPELNSKK